MNVAVDLFNKTEKIVRDNSSSILTALGVSGALGTAYLASKASFQAADRIMAVEIEGGRIDFKEKTKVVWKLYIPATISATMTVTCIIGAAKINSRRAAALTAAYSLTEKAFSEYKEKVVETLGEKKEKKVRDEIAADQLRNYPPQGSAVVLSSPGDVLCCEMWTGRYFSSDMETLRRAVNTINAKLISENEASLSDFYYLVNLPNNSGAAYSGWTVDKMLELHFTTLLHDSKPVLAFEYNYVRAI